MRIVAISDTHNQLDKVNLPDGDLLIHAGDQTFTGTLTEVMKFNSDLAAVVKHYTYGAIVIAGNHDMMAEQNPTLYKSILQTGRYLRDELSVVEGVRIYGSPWTPRFHDWAFNADRGVPIRRIWANIPVDTDVLVTHGPPYGRLDQNREGEHCGCEELLVDVVSRRIPLHIFGHIHQSYGVHTNLYPTDLVHSGLSVNASVCNEDYYPVNPPVVIDYDPATRKATCI